MVCHQTGKKYENDGNYKTVRHQQHCWPDSMRIEHASHNRKKVDAACNLYKETLYEFQQTPMLPGLKFQRKTRRCSREQDQISLLERTKVQLNMEYKEFLNFLSSATHNLTTFSLNCFYSFKFYVFNDHNNKENCLATEEQLQFYCFKLLLHCNYIVIYIYNFTISQLAFTILGFIISFMKTKCKESSNRTFIFQHIRSVTKCTVYREPIKTKMKVTSAFH